MKLKVEYLPINELKPYENNAKIHTPEQIEQIKKSIQKFGMNDPIGIWGKDNLIVEGHGRLMACKELGYKEVPVIRLDDLTDEQRKAYTLVHNQTTMNTGFDIDILNEELESIDIDMSDFGFDVNLDDIEEPTEGKENEIPEVQDKEPKAKMGEIYQLGRHRLMCGDATSKDDIKDLIDGNKIDLALTDPPYGVKAVESSGHNNGKKYGHSIAHDNIYMPIKGDETTDTAKNNYEIIKEISDNQIIFGGNYFTDFLSPSRCWVVWDKDVSGSFADGELAWTSFDKNLKIYKYTWSGMRREGDRKEELTKRVHPTQKPVGLLSDILEDFSESNDNILDCFGGSGSTLIACEKSGRTCYMMEYEPHYIDVIIERWENFTGQKAKLLKEV